jgi:uncharacterized membrane protein
MPGKLRNWVRLRLITGFFVTVPAIATGWFLYLFWEAIDDFFWPIYQGMFGTRVPGLGFLTAVVLIFVMGIIATNVVGRRALALLDGVLGHVPVFGSIYPSVKQFFDSFSPRRRSTFKELVLVEHPRQGEFMFGFVTSEVLVEGLEGKREMVSVFVPTNNLYLGDIVLVARDDVRETGLSVEEGVRIILSAGTGTPARLPRARL